MSAKHTPPTGDVATLCAAALAVIQAVGNNAPDWINAEIQELIDALADVNHGPIGDPVALDPCVNCDKPTPTEEWVVHQASCRDCFYDQMEEPK